MVKQYGTIVICLRVSLISTIMEEIRSFQTILPIVLLIAMIILKYMDEL